MIIIVVMEPWKCKTAFNSPETSIFEREVGGMRSGNASKKSDSKGRG